MKKKRSLKRTGMSLLAIFFPWIILLLDDNPGGAIVAIVLQATVIGWLPASMWAWRIARAPTEEQTNSKKIENS